MASSVNNIAATFSALTKTPSSSVSPTAAAKLPLPVTLSIPTRISTAWNPHAGIPESRRHSLVNFYGPPGPPPSRNVTVQGTPIPAVLSPRPAMVGRRVPSVTLTALGRNDAVRRVGLASLCRGKRRVVVVGVAAAFSPACTRFVERVVLRERKGWDLIACVAGNDAFVMRAWGENLGVGEGVVMLSDGGGELAEAFGASSGLGVRRRRFSASVVNGVVSGVEFDDESDDSV